MNAAPANHIRRRKAAIGKTRSTLGMTKKPISILDHALEEATAEIIACNRELQFLTVELGRASEELQRANEALRMLCEMLELKCTRQEKDAANLGGAPGTRGG